MCAIVAAGTGDPHAALAQAAAPTLETIRENVRHATGTLPPDETITTSFVRNGVDGVEVRRRAGKDYRVDTTIGPLHRAYGSAGGVVWRQNENGETVRNAQAPSEPLEERETTTVEHVSTPREQYVISALTPGGRGERQYIDATTWHIVRAQYITANETQTTTYDDFRTTEGYTRAWHRTVSDGHIENEASFTIDADDVKPIAAADLAVPSDRRRLVEFPAGTTTLAIPTRLEQGKFVVRIMVGERGLDFLLDSGASGIVIDRDVAQSLGLPEYASYSNAANAGRYVGTTTIVPDMSLAGLRMHDVVVETTPNVGVAGFDFKVVGLLGFDFLRDVDLKLDYNHASITAYEPSSYVAPAGAHTIALAVRLGSFVPQTTVAINGAVGTRFVVDTGGLGALMVDDYFRRRYPTAVVDERNAPEQRLFRGVGGSFSADRVTLKEFTLGSATFENAGAYVVTTRGAYEDRDDGIVGVDLLHAFTVDLDLPHDKIFLVPIS